MGLIGKAASIVMLGGVSSHSRRDPLAGAAKAQAELAEAEAKVAEEQAAVIAKALHEDEAHRQADLEEVAKKEAEAVPWDRPGGAPAIGWRGQVQTRRRASATRRRPLVAIGGDLRPWPPPGRGDQREPTWTTSWW